MKRLATVLTLLTGVCLSTRSQDLSHPLTGSMDTIREVSVTPLPVMRADTIPSRVDWHHIDAYRKPFPYQSFILPAAFVAYGFTALHNNNLQHLNSKVREEVWMENPHPLMHADNYLMFVPALAVYGLNAAGIHGQHNFKDRTMILLMSQLFANGAVFSLKGATHELRPDGSDYQSFPSGHTAEAFANAEFMRMEYKDVSPFYGLAGYAVATATGMLRVYNNKHWMSDVVAGAGFGIASTQLAYWLYPKMQHWFGKDKRKSSGSGSVLMPTYQNGSIGLSFAHHF